MIQTTEKEKYVLKKLHERVNKITGGKIPSQNLAKSIVAMCSVWSFPVIFENENLKEISDACQSLKDKGLVKQFDDKGCISFVPVSCTYIVENKYREFSQQDIW